MARPGSFYTEARLALFSLFLPFLFLPDSLLFWSDWDDKDQRIERAFMDGSNRTRLKSSNLKYPNGLAIDFNTSRLYWCDAGTDQIGSMLFDGTSAQIHYEHLSHPFGLVVYNDDIYWTDWQKESIYRGSKYIKKKTVLRKESEYLYGVRVFTKENQPGTVSCKKGYISL